MKKERFKRNRVQKKKRIGVTWTDEQGRIWKGTTRKCILDFLLLPLNIYDKYQWRWMLKERINDWLIDLSIDKSIG